MTSPGTYPTGDPGPGYLEEAAEQLRLARADNEKRAAIIPSLIAGEVSVTDILREVNDRRIVIAEIFAGLAAIQEGMIAETGGYDVGVALQRLDIAENGPGS
jgi:hypothetical protein